MKSTSDKSIKIGGINIPVPIIQGGMGICVSLAPLAAAVAREGGIGVISSAALKKIVSKRLNRPVDTREAVYSEIKLAKELCPEGLIGINIMVFLQIDFEESVRGALEAGVNFIISGAGLPLKLPGIHDLGQTKLIPIVSSAKALRIICKRWQANYNYLPDAVVLEGPKAGGHLGFKPIEINDPAYSLENLLGPVKEVSQEYGDFPVIAAGGIFYKSEIKAIIELGANGVQMGTRFLATYESSASEAYKQAVVDAKIQDIEVAINPGSPCNLPFRVIKFSPAYQASLISERPPLCNQSYLLQRGPENSLTCPAMYDNKKYFCICNGLLRSAQGDLADFEEKPLYTVGARAHLVDKIVSVKELMTELKIS